MNREQAAGTENKKVAVKAFANHSFQGFWGQGILSADSVCFCSHP